MFSTGLLTKNNATRISSLKKGKKGKVFQPFADRLNFFVAIIKLSYCNVVFFVMWFTVVHDLSRCFVSENLPHTGPSKAHGIDNVGAPFAASFLSRYGSAAKRRHSNVGRPFWAVGYLVVHLTGGDVDPHVLASSVTVVHRHLGMWLGLCCKSKAACYTVRSNIPSLSK